jgi:lipoyl(octanoyl) transferase
MGDSSSQVGLVVRDLGRMAYGEAVALQRQLQGAVINRRKAEQAGRRRAGYLLLVEHDPPVITVSRRKGVRQHLTATEEQIQAAGVVVAETDRGGDITYHGPGQLVAYLIVDLNVLGLRIHGYMRMLEQVVIDTLERFGIAGHRDESATGVWVDCQDAETPRRGEKAHGLPSVGSDAKICAMGVRISRWVSMHGLALNVTTNLDHFSLIIPCGLVGRSVTSMGRLLGDACPPMDEVKRVLAGKFKHALTAPLA